MARNPKWTRDELILALDLYFQVVELGKVLNRLKQAAPRTPSSIAMKLGNFSGLDDNRKAGGLAHGSKLDKEVWAEFVDRRSELSKQADALRRSAKGL